MNMITSAALFFLAAGIFTSVTILSAYQILFIFPLIYFTYLSIKENNYQLPKSAWWLLAFTLVALVSSLINFELMPKPTKNIGKLKYFIFGVGGIFVLRAWLRTATEKTKKIILTTFFASIVVASLYALFSLRLEPRAKGLTETMRYGYGTAMMLLTLLSGILHHHKLGKWFNWKIASMVFIFGFVGMYVTYTRGALLGFICGIPFVLYFFKKKLGLTFGIVSLVGVLGLLFVYLYGTGKSSSRFLLNKNNSSDIIRRSQWKASLIATKEKPYLGWGLSNFHTQLKRIKFEHDLDAKHYIDGHSHNLFLEVSSGTGIIGLFFFLGWMISWAWEVSATGGLIRAMIFPFGVAFFISSQFEVTFDANNASMIFFLYSLSSAQFLEKFSKKT